MEQRLIDANALTGEFEWCKQQAAECNHKEWDEIITRVSKQPPVDAVPVIHAKWVQNPYSDEPPTCSHCGFESSYYYDRSKSVIENRNGVLLSEAKSKYCPNCGAKMDGADGERISNEDQHIYD